MKSVWLSDQDRAIIKTCLQVVVMGKSSLDDLRALLKAEDAIAIDAVPAKDLLSMSSVPSEYKLEDAWIAALKHVLDESRERLLKNVAREYVRCYDHFEAAKDVGSAG